MLVHSQRLDVCATHDACDGSCLVITNLGQAGVLSASQASRLLARWPDIDEDWFASPFLADVREHTKATIEALVRHNLSQP